MELARNLKVESVSRLNPTAALCLRRGQTVREAVDTMRRHRVGCVLVSEKGRIVGLFTERDLLRRVLAAGLSLDTPIERCMTAHPVTVEPSAPIDEAVLCMEEGGYRHLPVVDDSGRPMGVLSVKRIVHYLVEHFPSTIYCLLLTRTYFPNSARGREGTRHRSSEEGGRSKAIHPASPRHP